MELNEVIRRIRPYNPEHPYIFISYSGNDRNLVWRDVLEFQRRGYNIWLDEKNLDKSRESWKEDALAAIEDMDCELLVFYVSASSLCSRACYNELMKTMDQGTCDLHNGPVKFIAVDAEEIGNIISFKNMVFDSIKSKKMDKAERSEQIKTLSCFVREVFNNNNEKVRIHPKYEKNRKLDYYEDILAAFPDSARLAEKKAESAAGADTESAEEEKVRKAAEEEAARKAAEEEAARKAAEEEAARKAAEEEAARKAAEEEAARKAAEEEAARKAAEEKARHTEKPSSYFWADTGFDEAVLNPARSCFVSESNYWEIRFGFTTSGFAAGKEYRPKALGKADLARCGLDPGHYVISEGYTEIKAKFSGDSCLAGMSNIRSLYLPDSMKKLRDSAFKGCMDLEEVRLPGTLTSLDQDVFNNCVSLKSIRFPRELQGKIGNYCFNDNQALESIAIPYGVQELGRCTFSGCISLKSVVLAYRLEGIGEGCFSNCKALEYIDLPPQLKWLGEDCFSGSGLRRIVIPGSVKRIPETAFSFCDNMRTVVLKDGVEEIESMAFCLGIGAGPYDIWIPDSVCTIAPEALGSNDEVTIHCHRNSAAQAYAEQFHTKLVLYD